MEETLNTVASGIESGNYSQIVKAALSAETIPMLALMLKVFIWIVAVVVFIGFLNVVLLPLFNLEFTIKGVHFGGKRREMFRKKGQRDDKPNYEKEVFINALKNSIINLTSQINEATNDRNEEVSEETKEKIDKYIERVVKLYKTSLSEDYKGKDKDSLLLPESLEYFKELMMLASYKNNVIEKTMKAVTIILEQNELGFNKTDVDESRRQLFEEILDSYQSIFYTSNYPFNEKISSSTAEQVIQESAKKQVNDIIEKLEDAVKVKDEAYNKRIELIVSQYINQIEKDTDKAK